MQLKFTTTLYLLALATGLSQACHHPRPHHDVSCSLSFKRGKLSSNGTHILIQGTTTQSTRCQKKRDELPQSIAGGSVIHIFTKDTVHVKDAQGKTHHGNDCQVNVPDFSLPSIDKSEITKLVVPLEKDVVVDCKRRQTKKSGKKHSSTTVTPTATPKAKHTPTPTTHHKTTTTTSSKKAEPTHHDDDDDDHKHKDHDDDDDDQKHKDHDDDDDDQKHKDHDDDDDDDDQKHKDHADDGGDDDDDDDDDDNDNDWDYDDGEVTFFTPNQGACGEWNDDNDLIAALGEELYGDMDEESKLCGKKILIQGPKGNDVTVTVRDACPPCDASHIDLSPAAFAKLGAFDTGVLKVKWKFL